MTYRRVSAAARSFGALVAMLSIGAVGLAQAQAKPRGRTRRADPARTWATTTGKTLTGKLRGATTKSIVIQASRSSSRQTLPWSRLTESDRDKARTLLLVLEAPAPRLPATGVYSRIYPLTRQARSVLPKRAGGEPDFAAVFGKRRIGFDGSVATAWRFNGMHLIVTQTPAAHQRIAAMLRKAHAAGARDSEFGALPVTGIEVPALADLDPIVVKHIKHTGEEAIMLAVMYNGRLVYRAAYGWADKARTRPVDPDKRSPIGSSIKPVTHKAIDKLLEDHNIDRDAKMMPILKLKPLRGRRFAKGVDQITINHLLSMRSGVINMLPFPAQVGQKLRLGRAATGTEVFAYQLSQPLRFQPGAGKQYSNAGYQLLGAVMEAVTGQSAAQYMQDTQMAPHGAYSLHPPYHNLVYPPASWNRYRYTPGAYTYNLCAGLAVITAPDYLRWSSGYEPDRRAPFKPPRGAGTSRVVGQIMGAASVMARLVRPGKEIRYALIFFQRGKKRKPDGFLPLMLRKRLMKIRDWPSHDLFDIPDPRARIPRQQAMRSGKPGR